MSDKHGSYYVPEYSIWPIIGAIGLFLFALGSLNFDATWGVVTCILGILVVTGMLVGWFRDIIHESQAGLYDAQMERTFRWGMFWLIFCETCLFCGILGAAIYVQAATLPGLAGTGSGGSLLTHYLLWPNFQDHWPLIQTPNPQDFTGLLQAPTAWGLPAINTLIIFVSAITATVALAYQKNNQRIAAITSISATIVLGSIFFIAQIYYLVTLIQHYGLNPHDGIYASLLCIFYGFYNLHIFAGLILLIVNLSLLLKDHFINNRSFGFEAAIWFWNFLNVVWLASFVCLFWL